METAVGIGFGFVGLLFVVVGGLVIRAAIVAANAGRPKFGTLITGITLLLFGVAVVWVAAIGFDRLFASIDWILMQRVLPTLGMVAGGLCTLLGVGLLVRAHRSRQWNTAEGTIMQNDIVTDSAAITSVGVAQGALYRALLQYRYTVDDREYTASTVSAADMATNSIERARKVAEKYQAGSSVTVYYDPRKPSRAVLQPGITAGAWLPVVVGIGITVISTIMRAAFVGR